MKVLQVNYSITAIIRRLFIANPIRAEWSNCIFLGFRPNNVASIPCFQQIKLSCLSSVIMFYQE